MSSTLWQEAAAFAARAHRHQERNDGTPYASHPSRVAMTISTVFCFNDPEILAAAFLHDTIEDCDVDYDDILKTFGCNVANYVAVMTKDMRLEEEIREIAYDKQLAEGPWQGRLIKIADVYDNFIDTTDQAGRAKLAAKANRALMLATNDKQLIDACNALRTLIAEEATC
ncbi:MAG: HD domain-containing protein [Planctomycetota bacterium]|nr:HD domain-containing protein [Planctomycetota bacterium]